jgi:hypothetical protein
MRGLQLTDGDIVRVLILEKEEGEENTFSIARLREKGIVRGKVQM